MNTQVVFVEDNASFEREILLEHLGWCAFDHDCNEAVLELLSKD